MAAIKRARISETAIFLITLVCYVYFFPRWADWNQNSRFDLVVAALDKGTLRIDDYYHNTGDYAYFDGHYYTDKAPGVSFLGMPIYGAFKVLGGTRVIAYVAPRLASNAAVASTLNPAGMGLLQDRLQFAIGLTLATLFVVAIPSALLCVLLYRLLGNFSKHELYKWGLTLAYGLATPAFAYSNNFYSHQVVAFCLFASFYLLFRWRSEPNGFWSHPILPLLLIGFLLGFSIITEYPTALIAGGIGLYALYKVRDWRRLVWLALGMAPPLILLIAYDLAIFGTPLPVGYRYSATWQAEHSAGLIGIVHPLPEAFWGITFGAQRGLFIISPFLLLALPGFYCWWRGKTFRPEWAVSLWAVISFLIFNSSTVNWNGGYAVGPRYLVPMLPFMALPIIFFLEAARAKWVAVLTGLLMLASGALVWAQTIGGQSFPQYQANPLWEYSLGRLMDGDIARNVGTVLGFDGWTSLLPLVLVLGLLAGAAVYVRRLKDRETKHGEVHLGVSLPKDNVAS